MTSLRERYRLGPQIGGGGMAEVYEATLLGAEGFTRPVAVKRMRPALSNDPRFGSLFVNEARVAALLHHPNIAAVLDFDRDDEGRYFLVMELIRGVDLRKLTLTGRLPLAVALHITAEILRGLAYAHQLDDGGRVLGIVHRDVSPHNVMLSWDGAVKLVDFGIAKALAASDEWRRTTGLRGKVAYMSPEQAKNEILDHRSDQFAAGLIAYELVVGRRVFEGATDPEILARLLTQPIPPPRTVAAAVPADVDAAIMRMLERSAAARFPTTQAALEALLSSPAMNARGGLELAAAIRERFAGEAPRRRGHGETPRGGLATPGLPDREPAGTGAVASRAAPRAASGPVLPIRTFSALPAAVATTATRPTESQPAPSRSRPRGTSPAIVIGLLGVAAVAAGVAVRVALDRDDGVAAGEPAVQPPGEPVDAAEPTRAVVTSSAAAGAAPPADPPVAAPAAGRGQRKPRTGGSHDPSGSATVTPSEGAPLVGPDAGPRPARGKATVIIKVAPWADVEVDGKRRGVAPLTLTLTAGEHDVVLRNAELGRKDGRHLELEDDEVETIELDWR